MFQKVRMNNLMADSASTGSLPPIIKRSGIERNYHFTGNNRVADFLKIFEFSNFNRFVNTFDLNAVKFVTDKCCCYSIKLYHIVAQIYNI